WAALGADRLALRAPGRAVGAAAPAPLTGGAGGALPVGPARVPFRTLPADLGLAIGADPPTRVERPGAPAPGVAQPPLTVRAAQIVALDGVLAMRAGLLDPLAQLELSGAQLQLALLPVLQELGRPQDRVDDRAQVREDRRSGRARDQHGVLDAPPRIQVGPVDQRQIDDDQEEDQQIDD